MTRRHAPAPQESLLERNTAHIPRYWMLLTPDEAHELAERRVPDQVQQMAQWLDEDSQPKPPSTPTVTREPGGQIWD